MGLADFLLAKIIEVGYSQGSPEYDALDAWKENKNLSLSKLLGIFRGELDACSNCGKLHKKGPDFCSDVCRFDYNDTLRSMRR